MIVCGLFCAYILAVKNNLHRYRSGAVILREGASIKDLFIVKTGKVKVEHNVDGKEVKLAELGTGDIIGYYGAILGEKQFTTVTALERTTIYRLTLNELQSSAGGEEAPIAMVLVALTRKLQEAGKKLATANISLN